MIDKPGNQPGKHHEIRADWQPWPEEAADNPNGELARVYSFATMQEIKPMPALPSHPTNLWSHLGAQSVQAPGTPIDIL